jgi:hypothetical protein
VADSEAPVKKVVVKKPQPEPQPLWTRVGVDFTREEIEERILVGIFPVFSSILCLMIVAS